MWVRTKTHHDVTPFHSLPPREKPSTPMQLYSFFKTAFCLTLKPYVKHSDVRLNMRP